MHYFSHPQRFARPLILALGLLATAAASAVTAPLAPAEHASFGHYTFALTWQPGFCSTDGGCLANQPHGALIGLHGLWASRPRSLIERGVSAPQWWRRGCDYYHRSHDWPRLSRGLRARLRRVMPHLRGSLLRHEYDKHVQCFGFNTQGFFDTELAMRRQVVGSAFGRYLIGNAGHMVQHADVTAAFMRAFHTDRGRALQLQCGRNRRGQEVLTQLWITIPKDALASFPGEGSLSDAVEPQDNCPARFLVPNW